MKTRNRSCLAHCQNGHLYFLSQTANCCLLVLVVDEKRYRREEKMHEGHLNCLNREWIQPEKHRWGDSPGQVSCFLRFHRHQLMADASRKLSPGLKHCWLFAGTRSLPTSWSPCFWVPLSGLHLTCFLLDEDFSSQIFVANPGPQSLTRFILCLTQQEVRIQKRWCLKDESVVGKKTIFHLRQAKCSQGTPRKKIMAEHKQISESSSTLRN